MPAALRWKSKLMLTKIETVYGTDPTPTAYMVAKNVVCRPMEGEDVSRDIERPWRGPQEMFPVGLRVVLEFDVELVGAGDTGVAPAYSALLRSCGLQEVVTPDDDPGDGTVVYTPVSDSMESSTIYFWIGGNRQIITGVRGNCTINIEAQQIPHYHFTLTGLYAAPTAVSLPAVDSSDFMKPLVATHVNTPVFTIGGVSFVMRRFAFDFANDVQPRLLVGRTEIAIPDSNESIDTLVEAVPLATFNPFSVAENLTQVALAVQHDTRAGHKVAITAPACTLRRPTGYENDQGVLMWPLRLAPLPSDTGNDQFSITLT